MPKFPDNGFEAWGGYMQAKISKLEEQFASGLGKAENQLTDIFKGISIYVNGYTVPSADELKELMAKHGGVYHTYQRSDDFIIASNLPDTKVKNMCLSRVVKPEWITESIAVNCLLNFKDYLLYRNSKTQPQIKFIPNKGKEYLAETKSDHLNPTIKLKNKLQTLQQAVLKDNTVMTGVNNIAETEHFQKNKSAIKSAADPSFISEFYNNSRLHHISQLGACFKQYVNDLREKSNFLFNARDYLKTRILSLNYSGYKISNAQFQNFTTIMHIDMDCFFVSVGLRNMPQLRGKPVAVTHSKGGQPQMKRSGVDRAAEFNLYKQKVINNLSKFIETNEDIEIETKVDNITDEDEKFGSMSEIASCSYEARSKGIKNGMFMGAALKLCADLQTIPYDFEGYKEVAFTLYDTISQYTLDIEAVSCDEMYVDCTELLKTLNVGVQEFASALREEIKNKTGCPCSTGFGGNRLQARLATKQAKPDGQYFLTSDCVDEFMCNINLRDLPGVGRQTYQKLESLGHQTCGSLQSLSLVSLKQHLGNKIGFQLYNQCRGYDPNPLTFYTVRKSVSAEVNYGIRFENSDQCEEFLKQLSAEVHSRMTQLKVTGKCITLKLMVRAKNAPVETAKFMGHGFCDVINKSSTLQNATNDLNVIIKEVITICKKQNVDPKEMRGVGIQITKLESNSSKIINGAIDKFFLSKPCIKAEQNVSKTELVDKCAQNMLADDGNIVYPSTPKKLKVISPDKKSPGTESLRSPIIGKKRGRPFKSIKPQMSTSQNLINKFLQVQGVSHDNCLKKERIIDKAQLEFPKKSKETPQSLLDLPWEKVKELVRAWFDSHQSPTRYDIDLIAAYLRGMITDKNIDKVYVLVNFINRKLREMKNDEWNSVGDYIIQEVQNAMLAVYGKKIWINEC